MFAPADSYVPQCAPRAASVRGPLVVWATVTGIALGLVGLIIAAPLLMAHGHTALGLAIYDGFGKLCHQLPERSLHLEGNKLAVCSRCLGLYAGFALSVLLYPLARSLNRVDTPRRLWLLLAALPIGVDWTLGFFDLWANTHLSRFMTGALFSAVAAVYILPGLIDLSQSVLRRHGARSQVAHQAASAAPSAPLQHTAPSDYSSPSSRI
ncbi:MAG TPA: DUF2085 domain-containing protein [Pyrinomonadaceae bacterium]|jgi:uncharacterized membrane protein